jgi:hypothetical protein
MFESRERLAGQIQALLDGLREAAAGRYACLVSAGGILFEGPEPEARELWALRRLVEERVAALLAIPAAMASGGPSEDLFESWHHDELLLAVLNQRVALLVACPDAEAARERVLRPLSALVDRLLRYEPRFRIDARGRGFFFGRPKLDLIVIGRARAQGGA